MTKSDKWKKRDCVQRYWQFKDECRVSDVQLPACGARITFHMPMPKSWSRKKKANMHGKPHQQKPDLDNLLKAVGDALFDDDSCIWDISAKKVWSDIGKIEIEVG